MMQCSALPRFAFTLLMYGYSMVTVAQHTTSHAAITDSGQRITMGQWLTLPPMSMKAPVFHNTDNIKNKIYADVELLNSDQLNFTNHFPEADLPWNETAPGEMRWKAVQPDGQATVMQYTAAIQPTVVYLATYLRADRWLKVKLELRGDMMMKAWLGSREVGTKTTIDTAGGESGEIKKELKLERGTHLLLIKLVIPGDSGHVFRFSGMLECGSPFSTADITPTLSPKNRKNIYHILDGVKISGISISPDGQYYLVHYQQALPSGGQSERWSEIRRVTNQRVVHSYRHGGVSQIRWLPQSNRVSWVSVQGGKSSVYVYDIERGVITMTVQGVERMAGYQWAPDESFMIFSVREEPDDKDAGMLHLRGMPDRQPGWRNRSFLYRYDVASGMTTRLTWGNLTTSLQDISPDSRKMLFSQHFPDFTERPYSRQHLFVMDLATHKTDTILYNARWGVRASFSPDGQSLLATGGPEAFDGAGLGISKEHIPHNSDIQAYIYDLESKKVRSITLDFNPSVESAFWHPGDQQIYLLTADEDYRRLYRYDRRRERFNLIISDVDYISDISFAAKAPLAVFGGNLTTRHPSFHTLDLRSLKVTPLEDSESDTYKHVELGATADWNFTASSGVTIKGRIYYPPNFDPAAKYPVIVYYYGGIRPVSRTFAGRYPFNLWAGNGYVVYVLQPSGAVGFGQEFSSAHVNNWGITVADEIIEGTTKFLDAHAWADRSKVGCAGASYGGFMTMLLLTRTQIFATAISHAGISSISSYWGEGFWGYSYSAGASAESFPWNNKELYIGQSPLFHADKIITPLLLITGDEDTNVPPGESIQMYTALKLLGRPVELVLVKGENHHILDYTKRIQWHNTMMAWWDKYLKEQPEWWKELYPAAVE